MRHPVSPQWQALLAKLDSKKRFDLKKLAEFCTADGIAPEAVDDEVLSRFGALRLQHRHVTFFSSCLLISPNALRNLVLSPLPSIFCNLAAFVSFLPVLIPQSPNHRAASCRPVDL